MRQKNVAFLKGNNPLMIIIIFIVNGPSSIEMRREGIVVGGGGGRTFSIFSPNSATSFTLLHLR